MSAAPASSPIPCTHVERAVGQAGVARDVGEHRRGERRPLRRLEDHGVAGRERGSDAPGREHQRRVPRRDHGRDARTGPTRHVLGEPVVVRVALARASSSWSAKNRKFRATRGMTEFRIERSSDPLSRVSTAASSGTRASTPSAIAVQDLGALLRRRRAPDRERPHARRRPPRSASAAPPRATSAIGCSSIGETSAKVVGRRDARRRRSSGRWRPRRPRRRRAPWRPSPRVVGRGASQGRSDTNGMAGAKPLSSLREPVRPRGASESQRRKGLRCVAHGSHRRWR